MKLSLFNVSAAWRSGGLKSTKFDLELNFLTSTKLGLSTHPAILPNRCYVLGGLSALNLI